MKTDFKNLPELLDYFKDEKTCLEYLEESKWHGNPVCPSCGKDHPYRTATRSKRIQLAGTKDYKCSNKECGKKFTVLSGTILENSKIGLRNWLAAMYLVTAHKKGISSLQLGRDLDITQKTAWFLLHRIREMLKEEAPELLDGTLEGDETFVGGKNINRHENKKVKNVQKSPEGRDYKDKTPVLGIVQRGGKVRTFVVKDTEKDTLQNIMRGNVAEGSTFFTDAYSSYIGLNRDYNHISVKHHRHGNKYITVGDQHTNTIEGFWSLLKRGIFGIYHQVSPQHLHRYCNEFGYRYNTRKIEDRERFVVSVSRIAGKRLTYEKLTEFSKNKDKKEK